MEAALLELFAAATRARIVPADSLGLRLQRGNLRPQPCILGAKPGFLRRKLFDTLLEWGNRRLGSVWERPMSILTTDGVPLLISFGSIRGGPARELGIGQGPSKIRANVAYDHGIGQAAPKGLADSARHSLKHVSFRLFPSDPSGGRQSSQDREDSGANELIRLRRLDQGRESGEIAVVGADQDPLEGRRGVITERRFNGLTVLSKTA